jgi:excisionase family DNA binding protein
MQPTRTSEPEWLRVDEIARLLRVGPRCVRRLIHAGQLRAAAIGGRRQLVAHRDWVRDYAERQVVQCSAMQDSAVQYRAGEKSES